VFSSPVGDALNVPRFQNGQILFLVDSNFFMVATYVNLKLFFKVYNFFFQGGQQHSAVPGSKSIIPSLVAHNHSLR